MIDTPQKIVDSICLNFDVAEECYDSAERHVSRENLKDAPARIQALIDGATSERDGMIAEMETALTKAQEDFNWMLNERKFLTPWCFDYIESVLAKVKEMKDKEGKHGED